MQKWPQGRDLQHGAFHKQEKETNKEEKAKENMAGLTRWSDYAAENDLQENILVCGQCKISMK